MTGWTVAEAVDWLDPPIPRRSLEQLISDATAAGKLAMVGRRHTGRRGKPPAEYDIGALMGMHAEWVRGVLTCVR